MWVVKVGGSLESSPRIRELLGLLADYGQSNIVIVPGGGRFADRVRARQAEFKLDDVTAQVMAIHAMEQYAGVLCKLNSNLHPIVAIDEINDVVNKKAAVPVWLPGKLLDGQPDIPVGWQVTSDSLALWFAKEINAQALILIKSAINQTSDVNELAESGYLDGYFPQMIERTNIRRIACVCVDNLKVLKGAMTLGSIPAETLLQKGVRR